eukprot:TRINITY_DN22357_c0_g1_i2.p1 TRINITY_DN22357_c0_g1~~TRINITY_DN22357_c0_g1_i2.p1  ORF type:complete len:164 (-),score=33.76 TRINITY_DN22357_c0_g1_i2:8-499(-)
MTFFFFFLMIRRPPRSTQGVSSAASDVYKRQIQQFAQEENIEVLVFFLSMSINIDPYVPPQVKLIPLKTQEYFCLYSRIPLQIGVQHPTNPFQVIIKRSLHILPYIWGHQSRAEVFYKYLSLIHISEPTRPLYISYAVFCLKKKKNAKQDKNTRKKALKSKQT